MLELIPLSALPIIFRAGGRVIIPRFLALIDSKWVSEVIDYLENLVGNNISEDYLKGVLEGFIGDYKLSRALYFSLKYFYDFKKKELEEIFDKGTLRPLAVKNDWELKKIFYKWINEKHGYMPLNARDQLIREFAKRYSIEPEKLEELLENELPKNQFLIRKTQNKPKPLTIIGLYNFLVLEKLLSISEEAVLTIYGEFTGKIIKDIILRAKRHEVIADFTKLKNGVVIKIVGPHQLFKLPAVSEYGKHIATVIAPVIATYESWKLWMRIVYRKRKRTCEIKGYTEDSPMLTPYWAINREAKPKETYDSSIEEKIYNGLRIPITRNGWKIHRESDVIILPQSKKIIIPDFTIKANSKKVFIEVIGYWREKYVKKKKEKFLELSKENIKNIIAVIDTKLRKEFDKIQTKKIYYTRDHIPIGKLYREIIDLIKQETL